MNIERALKLIEKEARNASSLWPAFNSAHEGYAVLLEEVDELWEAIREKPRNMVEVRGEAIQVGAMVIRFLTDLFPKGAGVEKEWLTCSDCIHAHENMDMDNPESPCYKTDEDEDKFGDECPNFIRKEADS